jgi:hypothetical protein
VSFSASIDFTDNRCAEEGKPGKRALTRASRRELFDVVAKGRHPRDLQFFQWILDPLLSIMISSALTPVVLAGAQLLDISGNCYTLKQAWFCLDTQQSDDESTNQRNLEESHLLELALQAAKDRVVAKRPIRVTPLGGDSSVTPRPSYYVEGSVNRWDVYVKNH